MPYTLVLLTLLVLLRLTGGAKGDAHSLLLVLSLVSSLDCHVHCLTGGVVLECILEL